MMQINENYFKLPGSYLFSEIAKRKASFQANNPDSSIINMGIGDVTLPLTPSVISAMHKAVDEMGNAETFRGYPPEQGYDFLREAIAINDFQARGCNISSDEIFISDGAKSDCANIGDIFGFDNIVAVCDPVYPVYVDSNAMSGRAGDYVDFHWSRILYMPCTSENNFLPELPKKRADMIYLCFPNNPTGAVITCAALKAWVDYANKNGSVILYDAAYESYIATPCLPHSIFEIPGAETCAIEFRSYSKSAGFTGLRCAYTVVPKTLLRNGARLHELWNRRQCTKFNGVSYIIQRAAEAIYSDDGKKEQKACIGYYMRNAQSMRSILDSAGLEVCGGVDSPYLWLKLRKDLTSWAAFDLILQRCGVSVTPGVGFGLCGEGNLRLTAFGTYEDSISATKKIAELLA